MTAILKKGVVRSVVVRKVKENYGQENIKHFLASVLTFQKAMTWCEKKLNLQERQLLQIKRL